MKTQIMTGLQMINVGAIISMLTCILILFTERQLTICVIFRSLGFRERSVKIFFSIAAIILMVRLASYCADFKHAVTHPVSVLFHTLIAFGFYAVTFQIYRRRFERRSKHIEHAKNRNHRGGVQ